MPRFKRSSVADVASLIAAEPGETAGREGRPDLRDPGGSETENARIVRTGLVLCSGE